MGNPVSEHKKYNEIQIYMIQEQFPMHLKRGETKTGDCRET